MGSAASFQGVPLERRVLLTLRVEALTIYTGVCNLEQLINKAIGQAPAYSWPWQWSLQPLVMHAKVPHNTCGEIDTFIKCALIHWLLPAYLH